MKDNHSLPVEEEITVSKSQKKRDSLALQDLGQKMLGLKPEILRKLPLSEAALKAIIAGKPLKMGAKKRQVQYIGKLLRQEEPEALSALQSALTKYFK